jgi:tetratricopeptide (TPR) repeat protein
MSRIEKTVFISYRRTNVPWALTVFHDLTQHGYDAFIDFQGIASGGFEQVILENIRARAHFLVLLTPSALEHCGDPKDWLRREIETAMEARRNVVPVMLDGFDFEAPSNASRLTGQLSALKDYNALRVYAEYFVAAMDRLRGDFLNVPLESVAHPASLSAPARRAAEAQQAAAGAAPAVGQEELTAQTWFEKGFNAADLDEKIRCYTEAIRLEPNLAVAYNNRGAARDDKGDFDDALADYAEAIRLKPDNASAYYNRGNTRRDKGDHVGALKDYAEAIRLKPDLAEAYFARGLARAAKGDHDGALQDYAEAIRLKPDYAEAYYARGNARGAKGDHAGAVKDYAEAIHLKPDYAEAYYARGNARDAKGDLDGAFKDYAEAIRLKPDFANAYYNRGLARRAKSDPASTKGAIADFQKYLDLGGGIRDGDQAEVEQFIRDLKNKP